MAPVVTATPLNYNKHQFTTVESPLDDEVASGADHASNVKRDPATLGLPAQQGLYNPDQEKVRCSLSFFQPWSESTRGVEASLIIFFSQTTSPGFWFNASHCSPRLTYILIYGYCNQHHRLTG